MEKTLVILGPTATGKTSLALEIAKQKKGEIISADSRQIYKGLDIGTGKFPLPVNSRRSLVISCFDGYWIEDGIKIWGYDLIAPDEIFTAFDFARFAQEKIKDIQARGKLPILVGGTGFWIEMALGRVAPARVPPDWRLRHQLEEYPAEILFEKLKKMDLKRAESVDPKNKRRLIRAIEIATSTKQEAGSPSTSFRTSLKPEKGKSDSYFERIEKQGSWRSQGSYNLSPVTCNFILLTAPRLVLYQRIDERVDQMIRAGLIEEIKTLLSKGYSWNLPSMSGIGYRQFKPFIEGSKTLEECGQKLKFDTHAYARRQVTYFRRFKNPRVVDGSKGFPSKP